MPEAAKPTVLGLAADLAAGRTTSRELVEAALARIADPAGEGARSFVKVYADNARAAADAQDRLRRAGYVASPLAGLPVRSRICSMSPARSRLAGSKALDDRAAGAQRRAGRRPAARRRRRADRPHQHDRVRLFRRRHQSALRHAGQPSRPPPDPRRLVVRRGGVGRRRAGRRRDRQRHRRLGAHPGGAVRPRRVQADAAPNPARRRDAAVDDARLRSARLANSVACCAIADAVMAGEPAEAPPPVPVDGLRLAVPRSHVFDGLAPRGRERVRGCLRRSVARRRARRRSCRSPNSTRSRRSTPAAGSRRSRPMPGTEPLIERRGNEYDPRVRDRIERAAGMTAVEYIEFARRPGRSDRPRRAAHHRFRCSADADRGDHRTADRRIRARRGLPPAQRADPAQHLGDQFSRPLRRNGADPDGRARRSG